MASALRAWPVVAGVALGGAGAAALERSNGIPRDPAVHEERATKKTTDEEERRPMRDLGEASGVPASWGLGSGEIARLRLRTLGRAVTEDEVQRQVRPYLRRHVVLRMLHRLGLSA